MKELEKIGVHIRFNLNQPSFIDVARISDTFHQKLDTCTWLHLFPSLFISLSHYRYRVSTLSILSRRLSMPPSLRPRYLFTSRLYYFCRAHSHVCYPFHSNDRSSHQSISLRMRLECLEGPDMNTNGLVPATWSLTTRCSVIVTFKQSNILDEDWNDSSIQKFN